MLNVRGFFDVFSRRTPKAETPLTPLTKEFRNRVLMLCRDHFEAGAGGPLVRENRFEEMWLEMHKRLGYRVGRTRLVKDGGAHSELEDAIMFVLSCEDLHFLDFLEDLFQVDAYWRIAPSGRDPLVEDINYLFALDDLPYALTPFSRVERTEERRGHSVVVIDTVAHPRVILRQQQVMHVEAIEPALQLLAGEGFRSANIEFLAALTDYRKGDYEDCLAKCGSAFESTLKLICEKRGWPYNQNQTAATLLKTVIEQSGLPSYYEQPLLIVATLRNRESSSHGGGVQPKKVEPPVARYTINATAAAILLLVEHAG